MGARRPRPRSRRRQVDPAHRARPRRRPSPVRGAPARAARDLDRAAAFAAEPDGGRRPAHPPAVPRGAATRGLRADRARTRPAPRHRRPWPLGIPLGLGSPPSRRGDRRRCDPAVHARPRGVAGGAILRCQPVLWVSPAVRGTIELVVTRGVDAEDIYVLHAVDGAVTYEERSARETDPQVPGPERSRVEAFGIDGSRTEL